MKSMAKNTPLTNGIKVKPGIYIHYKKKKYRMIGCAKHTETNEELVVYQSLYGKGELWVRPKNMFFDFVEVEGNKVPRFKYISERE
jgi:hypothetical protein